MNVYPLETDEFAPVTVMVNGVAPVYTDVEFAITKLGDRPTGVIVSSSAGDSTLNSWFPAMQEGFSFGIQIAGYSLGTYMVWARVFNSTDTPVIEVAQFKIV